MNRETITFDMHMGGPMTGEEEYPILGLLLGYAASVKMSRFKGLPLMGGCFEKANIVKGWFTSMNLKVCLGSIQVVNNAMPVGTFGHEYNPPNELHSWCESSSGKIIDFALPGVILRGLQERDEFGPFLQGRKPVVLGHVDSPYWIHYKKYKEM